MCSSDLSFIMTLAMMQIANGVSAMLVRGQIAYQYPELVTTLGAGTAFTIPLGVNAAGKAMFIPFGWSIIVVTIAINTALVPLKLSSFKSMRKMQALKPQMDAIAAKYKGLKMTDPKKGEQQQEIMKQQ